MTEVTANSHGANPGLKYDGTKVVGAQSAAIVSITDTTGGAATDAINDTTVGVKDDIASLNAKIEEILVTLRTHGLIVT